MPSGSIYRRLLWPVYAPSTLLGVAAGATVPVQVVAAMHLGASGSVAALAVAGAGAGPGGAATGGPNAISLRRSGSLGSALADGAGAASFFGLDGGLKMAMTVS